MTKTLIIVAAFVTTMAASGSALAAGKKDSDHGQQFTNTKLLPYTYNPSRNKSVRDGGSRHGNYYD